MAGVTLLGMGRQNKNGLPPGLRRTLRDGLLIDIWYREPGGQKKRLREVLGDVPLVMAKDMLVTRRKEIIEGKMGGGSSVRVTLAEAFDRYIPWCETERPRSMRFRRVARARLCAMLGKTPLSQLTPWHLERYKREARKTLAPATIDLDIACFKHLIRRAAAWKMVSFEKAHELRAEVKLLRVPNGRERLLTLTDKNALLAVCPADLWEIVVAAMNLGARSGELRSLTWDKVDLDGRTVIVRRTKGKKPTNTRLHVNDDLLIALRRAEARKREGKPVFLTGAGRAWKSSWLGEVFKLAAAEAGIVDLHFHDLRHHFASTLVQRGISLQRVQKFLGHTRIQTTERYAHLAPDVDRATDVLLEGGEIRHLEEAVERAKIRK